MFSTAPLASAQAIGLPQSAVAAIRRVLAGYPEVEAAILYRSRALGRHRPASDIDLTLTGHAISNATLARIERAGVRLYQRLDPQAPGADHPGGHGWSSLVWLSRPSPWCPVPAGW